MFTFFNHPLQLFTYQWICPDHRNCLTI